MCYIFYGNQFTDQLRHALRMSIVALRRSLRANSGLAVVLLHPSNQESMLPLCLLQSAPVLLGLFYDLLCQHQHQHCQEETRSHNGSKLILCPPDDWMIRESIVPCNFDCCFLGLVNLCRILWLDQKFIQEWVPQLSFSLLMHHLLDVLFSKTLGSIHTFINPSDQGFKQRIL